MGGGWCVSELLLPRMWVFFCWVCTFLGILQVTKYLLQKWSFVRRILLVVSGYRNHHSNRERA